MINPELETVSPFSRQLGSNEKAQNNNYVLVRDKVTNIFILKLQ